MYEDDEEMLGNSQGFETTGYGGSYDEVGAPMLARPGAFSAAMRPAGPMRAAAPAARPAARLNPAVLRQATQRAFAGVTVEEARRIAREEIDRVRGANPTVPWSSLPTRATPREEAMWPLGIGLVQFDSTTPPNTPVQLVSSPQRPFRGERLVLDIRRIGATAQGPAVTITDFRVGDVPQRLGGGVLSAEIFAPDAFGVRLALDVSVPGVLITLALQYVAGAALAVGDLIVISGGIIGRATESADR